MGATLVPDGDCCCAFHAWCLCCDLPHRRWQVTPTASCRAPACTSMTPAARCWRRRLLTHRSVCGTWLRNPRSLLSRRTHGWDWRSPRCPRMSRTCRRRANSPLALTVCLRLCDARDNCCQWSMRMTCVPGTLHGHASMATLHDDGSHTVTHTHHRALDYPTAPPTTAPAPQPTLSSRLRPPARRYSSSATSSWEPTRAGFQPIRLS